MYKNLTAGLAARGWQAIQILRSRANIAVTELRFGCARRGRPSCLFLLSATQFLPPARRTCTEAVILPQVAYVCRISWQKIRNASFKFHSSFSLPWSSISPSYKCDWTFLHDTSSGITNILNNWRLRFHWPFDIPSCLVWLVGYVQIFGYHTGVGNHQHTRASGGHLATMKVVFIWALMWSALNLPGRRENFWVSPGRILVLGSTWSEVKKTHLYDILNVLLTVHRSITG
jgi:hypothetical protein